MHGQAIGVQRWARMRGRLHDISRYRLSLWLRRSFVPGVNKKATLIGKSVANESGENERDSVRKVSFEKERQV